MNKILGLIVGALVVLIGILAISANLGVPLQIDKIFSSLFLLIIGILLYDHFRKNPQKWMVRVTSFICFFLALMFLSSLNVFRLNEFIGFTIYYGLSVLFAYLYVKSEEKWWSILPAGIFFILGSIQVLRHYQLLSAEYFSVVFFLGLGLTFLYMWLQDIEKYKMWIRVFTLLSFLLSLLVYLNSMNWLTASYIIPVVLIALGVWFILRANKIK